jgi:hypothetical protein
MTDYNIKDSYSIYKQNSKKPVNIKLFLELNYLYIKFLLGKIFYQSKAIMLPCKLGYFSVVGKKQKPNVDENGKIKGLAPDWVKTKQLWDKNEQAKIDKKLMYHINSHTENIRYRFFWSKNKVLVANKTLYSFQLARANKRELNELIKNNVKYPVK